jgi:hypothetical protein
MEGVAGSNVFKGMGSGDIGVACGIRDDLGDLPSARIVRRTEVRAILRRYTWFIRSLPTLITTHYPSIGQPVDPYEEGVDRRNVLEELGARVFVESC